jgi:hypothetical protein
VTFLLAAAGGASQLAAGLAFLGIWKVRDGAITL